MDLAAIDISVIECSDDKEFYDMFQFGNPAEKISAMDMKKVFSEIKLGIHAKKMRQLLKRKCSYGTVRIDGEVSKGWKGVFYLPGIPSDE